MEEFSKPQYRVDVLKVEVPDQRRITSKAAASTKARRPTRAQKRWSISAKPPTVATKPFIYLSAGVSNAQFVESLNMAAEAGTDYSGVLCGRATWKEGIPIYAKQGVKALEDWLANEGVKNINAVNAAIKTAKPWYQKAGIPEPVHA